MYVPNSFQEADRAKLHAWMEQHSFATLISQFGAEPIASHLPLLLDRDAGPHGRLIGHMAKPNSQWQSGAGNRVLAIFHGPHAYISPTWYESQNTVPTWNYVAIHAYGVMRLIDDPDQLRSVIQRTVERYESPRIPRWSMQSPDPEFIDRLLAGIVGFEIDIDRLEGKWKLNQNHALERRQKVIRGLLETGGHDELQIAKLMADLESGTDNRRGTT